MIFFKSFLFLAFALQSNENKRIVIEVLQSYSKQCSYIQSIEKNIVKKLESIYVQVQSDGNYEALSCYRDNITAISSINYIYNNICEEVNKNFGKMDELSAERLFVGVQKYRKGIRLQHTKLNECLNIKKVPEKYIVDINFNRIEVKYLKSRILDILPEKDFLSNRVTYR